MAIKVPNARHALVEQQKITAYLLNGEHPDNGGKAEFFIELGFSAEDWWKLADAFRRLVVNLPVTESMESSHGTKYIVDGELKTPSGNAAIVRTVWIVERKGTIARLVTAYPHGKLL